MTQETVTQEPVAQEQVAGFTVQDLTMVKSIIEVASTRGAFKADELQTVGNTYTKLAAFLAHVEASQQPPAEEQEATSNATEGTE